VQTTYCCLTAQFLVLFGPGPQILFLAVPEHSVVPVKEQQALPFPEGNTKESVLFWRVLLFAHKAGYCIQPQDCRTDPGLFY